MSTERDEIQALMRGLEAQRGLLGDALVDAGLAPLRARLAELGAAPDELAAEQALKLVTIVFLDVVGSTRLSQHLDPEDIHAVIDGALARCTAVVVAHRGKVLQYAGDNLLAVFGADEAREDDAERAVRCGLALLAEGRALGAEVAQRHGHEGLGVRVGIHTGGVLLGGGVDAEGSIRGIAVNIAARMEQTAPPGGLRISQDTWRLAGGAFEVEPQAPISVKGVDAPLATYLVRGAKARPFYAGARGAAGPRTRMTGREAELAALESAAAAVRDQRRLALVAVVAEAGLGKSRLLQEFDLSLQAALPRPRIVRGRAGPHTPGEPFGLLRDVLAWQLGLGADPDREAMMRRFEAGVASWFEADGGPTLAQAHAHLLGHLIGLPFDASPHVRAIRDDPRQLRNRAFHVAAQILRRVAASGAVLLLEDLHWADEGSLDFLRLLFEANRDTSLLVVVTARPALFERAIELSWLASQPRIALRALDEAASADLATELLRPLGDAPRALLDLLVERAEGNPFYMEELLKMLADRGAIAIAGSKWRFEPGQLVQTELPATLTGVIQARLDALARAQRETLQAASVIGHVFWDRTLAALDARAPAVLPALAARELVLPRGGAEPGPDEVGEYVFGHKILHDVTYDTVLKRRRRLLHGRAAAWLGERSGARGEWLAAAAEHHALAGDAAQAAEFFARAAEYAKARLAHDAALSHVSRALALLGDAPGLAPRARLALRWRLTVVREFTLNLLGRREEQRPALQALREIADALDDDALRARAARRLSLLGLRTGDYAGQEAAAREAVACAERAGDDESRLEALRLLADALGATGRFAEGQQIARAGLAEARALGLRRVEGVFLNALSHMASLQDDEVAGFEFDLQDLPIWRELGDAQGEAVALGNVGVGWLWFGELERARPPLEEALRLCRAVGARQLENGPLVHLALLALWQGDPARAIEQAASAIEVSAAVDSPEFECLAWRIRGEAELALAQHDRASASFTRAMTLAEALGHGLRHDALAGRARAALAAGRLEDATLDAETLFERWSGAERWEGGDPRIALLSCHLVFARTGDPRAAEALEQAHRELHARAETIRDEALRASFLARVPHHREIDAAWAAARRA